MLDSARGNDAHLPHASEGSDRIKDNSMGRFVFLDALRGIGALGIACYHIHRYIPAEIDVDSVLPAAVEFVVRHGWMAVQMFWVIAGFVLASSLRRTAVTPASFGNFTLRRVVRLGTPYWAAILFVVALDAVTRQLLHAASPIDDPLSWRKFAANLAFLQDILGYGNISAGTWFVCVDLQFGLLFAAMLGIAQVLSRLFAKADGADASALALAIVFLPLGLTSLFVFNLNADTDAWAIYYFHMPLFGALAWWALEGRIPRGVFWAYAAALACGLAYRLQLGCEYKKPLDIAVALTVGITIYLVGRWSHLGDWLAARPLQHLGRISYSLFLVHYPISWIVVSVGCYWTGDNAGAAVFWMTASLLVSIGAADLFYRCVETPSLRLVKRLKLA
jgi:peptidoglycan/LPS O-acetylase OafA/YrhL